MTQLALSIPQTGLPNSTEDAKVASDLTQIQNVINGNLDAGNLSSTAGILRLASRNTAANTVAAAGELIITTAVPVTVTLPAPVANGLVGVISCGFASGASPTTVAGTNIFGVGANGVTSFKLGAPFATVLMQSDGTNWFIVSGQQDTGWVALSLPVNWGNYSPSFPAAARLRGDTAYLRGNAQNNTGGTTGLNITIPSQFRPTTLLPIGPYITTSGSTFGNAWQFTTVSNLNFGLGVAPGAVQGLEGISYSIA